MPQSTLVLVLKDGKTPVRAQCAVPVVFKRPIGRNVLSRRTSFPSIATVPVFERGKTSIGALGAGPAAFGGAICRYMRSGQAGIPYKAIIHRVMMRSIRTVVAVVSPWRTVRAQRGPSTLLVLARGTHLAVLGRIVIGRRRSVVVVVPTCGTVRARCDVFARGERSRAARRARPVASRTSV